MYYNINNMIFLYKTNILQEIHLVFNTTSAITITSPNVKWDTIPNLESNKTYEFIFTYINEAIGWLAHVISYS